MDNINNALFSCINGVVVARYELESKRGLQKQVDVLGGSAKDRVLRRNYASVPVVAARKNLNQAIDDLIGVVIDLQGIRLS
tara:strand:- start:1637 stop:1879 length:243 start_codon:yes stop_codon:yes gene_type:complete